MVQFLSIIFFLGLLQFLLGFSNFPVFFVSSCMMEERYHATTLNRFYTDMSNENESIAVEAQLTSPPTYSFIHPVGL